MAAVAAAVHTMRARVWVCFAPASAHRAVPRPSPSLAPQSALNFWGGRKSVETVRQEVYDLIFLVFLYLSLTCIPAFLGGSVGGIAGMGDGDGALGLA